MVAKESLSSTQTTDTPSLPMRSGRVGIHHDPSSQPATENLSCTYWCRIKRKGRVVFKSKSTIRYCIISCEFTFPTAIP